MSIHNQALSTKPTSLWSYLGHILTAPYKGLAKLVQDPAACAWVSRLFFLSPLDTASPSLAWLSRCGSLSGRVFHLYSLRIQDDLKNILRGSYAERKSISNNTTT
jgi:hypothetical protein